MSPVIRDRAVGARGMSKADELRRFEAALETLPLLTRTVFLLKCRDDFLYADISLRCGITVDEVRVRMGDALLGIDRAMRRNPSIVGRIRRALLPWRDAWAAARASEGKRLLGLNDSPGHKDERRGILDWLACAYELIR